MKVPRVKNTSIEDAKRNAPINDIELFRFFAALKFLRCLFRKKQAGEMNVAVEKIGVLRDRKSRITSRGLIPFMISRVKRFTRGSTR